MQKHGKYTVIVKVPSGAFIKVRYVENFKSLYMWLKEKHNGFLYMNVFDKTGKQVENFTKNDLLPKHLYL